jgi:phosphoglycerate dehydrogenase-like enzyme
MKVLIGPNPMGLEDSIPYFREEYPDIEFVHCEERENLKDEIEDATVYVGWLNREVFLAAEELEWVQSPSSGINYYLAIPEFVESDVLLTSARGTHGACLAESVFAMIFAFTRQIKDFVLDQQEGQWRGYGSRGAMCELTGSTMGIIGFGTVGRAVAKRAQAFDMSILAVDMFPKDKPDYVQALWGIDRLKDLLGSSDYVVVTVPYTKETEGMIGAEEIDMMRDGAMLVGISRGKIIDEEALVEALEEGRLSAAALDVFAQEPLPEDSPLWDVDNLLITPHAAGGTQYEGERVIEILKENMRRFTEGDLPLRNQIDKGQGF